MKNSIRSNAPMHGFDLAARQAYLTGERKTKQAIVDAEVRDGVFWMFEDHIHLLTDWTPGMKHGDAFFRRADPPSTKRTYMYLGKPAWRIEINGLRSARITNDPISFLANKTDHYVPEDCPINFIDLKRII